MPTGYTAAVADGTMTEFPAFALQCARAFGATIDVREEPIDAPTPAEFTPRPYHARLVRAAEGEIERLRHLRPMEAQREMQQEHSLDMAAWRERSWRDARQRARYLAMIEKASAWQPPTADHEEMKAFMLQQLRDSLAADCGGQHNTMPRLPRWSEWLATRIERQQDCIRYHSKHDIIEIERAGERTDWVRQLRASLAPACSETIFDF